MADPFACVYRLMDDHTIKIETELSKNANTILPLLSEAVKQNRTKMTSNSYTTAAYFCFHFYFILTRSPDFTRKSEYWAILSQLLIQSIEYCDEHATGNPKTKYIQSSIERLKKIPGLDQKMVQAYVTNYCN
jgi:hypothetical protein